MKNYGKHVKWYKITATYPTWSRELFKVEIWTLLIIRFKINSFCFFFRVQIGNIYCDIIKVFKAKRIITYDNNNNRYHLWINRCCMYFDYILVMVWFQPFIAPLLFRSLVWKIRIIKKALCWLFRWLGCKQKNTFLPTLSHGQRV